MAEPVEYLANLTAFKAIEQPSTLRRVSLYLNGKLFEWFAALNMTGVGLLILLWPATLNVSAFRFLVSHVTQPAVIGLGCFLIGYARLVALIINGRSWRYGPRVRAWCAAASAVIWLQFVYSLIQFAIVDTGVPSIGIMNWTWLFLGEIIVTYRAATNVRAPRSGS